MIIKAIGVQRSPYYQAIAKLDGGQIAVGFGSSHLSAINSCIDDVKIIQSLQ